MHGRTKVLRTGCLLKGPCSQCVSVCLFFPNTQRKEPSQLLSLSAAHLHMLRALSHLGVSSSFGQSLCSYEQCVRPHSSSHVGSGHKHSALVLLSLSLSPPTSLVSTPSPTTILLYPSLKCPFNSMTVLEHSDQGDLEMKIFFQFSFLFKKRQESKTQL